MSLAEANKNLKYDTRLAEINIVKGEITKEEWLKHLATLPDMAANTETFTIDGKSSSASEENH